MGLGVGEARVFFLGVCLVVVVIGCAYFHFPFCLAFPSDTSFPPSLPSASEIYLCVKLWNKIGVYFPRPCLPARPPPLLPSCFGGFPNICASPLRYNNAQRMMKTIDAFWPARRRHRRYRPLLPPRPTPLGLLPPTAAHPPIKSGHSGRPSPAQPRCARATGKQQHSGNGGGVVPADGPVTCASGGRPRASRGPRRARPRSWRSRPVGTWRHRGRRCWESGVCVCV